MEDVYLYDPVVEPADPSGRQDLIRRYGLEELAASVARTDAQGNKILANKMNKTYKKQVLDLNIPGAPEIPKNKYIMDLLLSGAAYQESDQVSYAPFNDRDLQAFQLRLGSLNGLCQVYSAITDNHAKERRRYTTAKSEPGDESSDDGSRFKQLERERKRKMKMKRETEAMHGDQKRRRYGNDG
ncbi:hypothetical protein MRB53_040537 [Persea americana]|nr:hypothetical protein MRB53_040537 [Persea americana]